MGQNGMITPKPSAGQDFEILLSPIKKMKNQKNIELSSGTWDRMNLDSTVQNIKEWKVQILLLNKNFRPTILEQISDIHFSKIKYLSIAENRINSMEPLCRVKMPSLQFLVLSKNLATTMNSVRKLQCPNLRYLNISFNSVSNLLAISQMHIPLLEQLKFEDLGQRRQCEYLNWIFRIEPRQLKRLVCLSAKRIQQLQTKKKLKEKYPDMNLRMLQTSSSIDLFKFSFHVFDSV